MVTPFSSGCDSRRKKGSRRKASFMAGCKMLLAAGEDMLIWFLMGSNGSVTPDIFHRRGCFAAFSIANKKRRRREFVEEAPVDGECVLFQPSDPHSFAGEFNFAGIAGGEEEIACFVLGGGEVAEECADVVLDAERDFTAQEAFPEFGHGQVHENVFGAGFAGELPELVAVPRDDHGDGAIDATRGFLYIS